MRPKLFITHLTQLQDARYCAATGIDYVGFSLRKGDEKKISPELLSDLTQWLSGPAVVVDFGDESPEEINLIHQAVNFDYARIHNDYSSGLRDKIDTPVIIRFDNIPSDVSEIIRHSEDHPEDYFEFPAPDSSEQAEELKSILNKVFFRTVNPEEIYQILQKEGMEVMGFVIGPWFEEEDGLFDYEACDQFLEKVELMG